jgi:transposase
MNKLREILRLVLTTNLSNRKIASIVGLSHTSINKYRNTLREQGLNFVAVNKLDDNEIEAVLKSKRGVLNISIYQTGLIFILKCKSLI